MADIVRDFMQRGVISVGPEATAAEVERTFVRHGIGGAPVVDQGTVIGVISRADLLRALALDQALAELIADYYRDPGLPVSAELPLLDPHQLQLSRVKELMTPRVLTVQAHDSVALAARLMLAQRVHRVLVLEGGRLAGVLTSHDLLRIVANEPQTLP